MFMFGMGKRLRLTGGEEGSCGFLGGNIQKNYKWDLTTWTLGIIDIGIQTRSYSCDLNFVNLSQKM